MNMRFNQSRYHSTVYSAEDIPDALDKGFLKVIDKEITGEETIPVVISLTHSVVPLKWPRRGYLVLTCCCYGTKIEREDVEENS